MLRSLAAHLAFHPCQGMEVSTVPLARDNRPAISRLQLTANDRFTAVPCLAASRAFADTPATKTSEIRFQDESIKTFDDQRDDFNTMSFARSCSARL